MTNQNNGLATLALLKVSKKLNAEFFQIFRMSAVRMAKSQKESKGVSQALNPRPVISTGRNFIRDHIKAVKAQEKEVRDAKEAQIARLNEGPKVNKKYAHVESRVFQNNNPLNSARSSTISRRINDYSENRHVNYTEATDKKSLHASFGRVPAYLNAHKAQLEDKKRKEAEDKAPKTTLPPGHRILPEDERLDTLALLQKRKDDVDNQISRLPLRIETDGQKRRQGELLKRLADIEQAIKFLSKPNVLIKMDE